MQFRNFDVEGFLRETWQRRPLLIRNPWAEWVNPLEPDDLAGLACEAGIESRLMTRTDDGWKLGHGPFAPSRFAKLGRAPWTLLVQAVNHAVSDVAALVEPFRFVPDWRIDDVMVSYAVDQGGMGPHYDHYDVFLIQGLGKRLWQVGAKCDASSELLPHDDLRLLADFQPTEEWLLEPGDVLYVPPGVAHNGVAVGDDCMPYSIGFRAPARSELVAHWCDDVLSRLDDDDRYADPDLKTQANPGEITADALAALRTMVTEKLLDDAGFARWFGEFNTARKYPDVDWQPEQPLTAAELRRELAAGRPLLRNPASRFSFVRQDADPLLLFVDGDCHECTGEAAALAELLCAAPDNVIPAALVQSAAVITLLETLYNQGCVEFAEED